jgi:hypothetical protein
LTKRGIATEERFDRFVSTHNQSGCWLWVGGLADTGYGVFWDGKKLLGAHRYSFMRYKQKEIPKGLFVCHTCDVRSCVNPEHLFLGTAKDNARDCSKKGRTHGQSSPQTIARGEKQGSSKLNDEQIPLIRARHGEVKSIDVVAREFGVSRSTIYNVVIGKQWKHIA